MEKPIEITGAAQPSAESTDIAAAAAAAAADGGEGRGEKNSNTTHSNNDDMKKNKDSLPQQQQQQQQQVANHDNEKTSKGDVETGSHNNPTHVEGYLPGAARLVGALQVGAPAPLPSLTRNQRLTNTPLPGAMAVSGGGTSQGQESRRSTGRLTSSIIDQYVEQDGHHQQQQQDTTTGMAKARLVEDNHDTIVAADPVDLVQRKRAREQQQRRFLLLVGGVVLVVVLIIVLGVVFATRQGNSDEDEVMSMTMEGTKATPATASPSSAPTSIAKVLHPQVQGLDLPDHTIRAITTQRNSSQHQAYEWLIQDPHFRSGNYSDWKARQRYALATLYFASSGQDWNLHDHWLEYDLDECHDWHFRSFDPTGTRFEWVYPQYMMPAFYDGKNTYINSTASACDEEGRYQRLILTKNTVVGSIPPEIALLTSLQFLDLSNNPKLTDVIPTELGLMTELSRLVVDRNDHTGPIPTELGLLTMLTYVKLGPNPLEGVVPTELGNLGASLISLAFSRSSGITGYLPTELFRLTSLHELQVQNLKGITGGTLEGIGALTNLRRLTAHDVPYGSPIPSEIGLLTKLSLLNLWNTGVSGSLPKEFWKLTDMQWMDIDDNKLTGTFPAELGSFSHLSSTWMNGNAFTGTFPPDIWQHLVNLTVLKMNGNQVVGTIPTEVGLMTSMEEIWFAALHMLTGTIPSEMGQMSLLEQLFLHTNSQLKGSIPIELSQLSALKIITLTNTSVTGGIPDELCDHLQDMVFTCGSYFGVTEQLCTDVEPRDFSCNSSMLCGCDYCEPCEGE